MVKRSIEQNLRIKNFEARNGNYERNAVVKNQGQNSVNKELLEIVGSGKPTGSVRKETIAVTVTISMSVRKQHSRILLQALLRGRMMEMHRKPRSPRGRSPSGRMFRLPCKDYLKGTCTSSFCEKWHPPEYLFYKSEKGCRYGEQCS